MAGEFDFISWVREQQHATDSVPLPAGDDLAVLKWDAGLLLIGADQVLDGVHFDSRIHTPRAIGRKVMNRNLSDCAAMACVPAAAVATVALPKGAGVDYAKELYLGLREAADIFDCPIVGGDTASWPHPLCLTVTILGKSLARPINRRGAKPGDALYVTGPLGGSILGRHMTFAPRVSLGLQLASVATSMIDLSDGISRDLSHICQQSGVGAIVNESAIPIHDDAIQLSRRDGISALEHALHDGEDHELLFTSSQPVPAGCIHIGEITAALGIHLRKPDGTLSPLRPQGWEHPLG